MAFPEYGSPSPTKPNQGKTPAGGLGQLMQSLLGKGGNAGAMPPQGPQGPAPMPQPGMPPPMPPSIPGVPPMPGPGAPLQGAGMQPGISPEEHAAILEKIKGELMKQIAGQSGQQDQIYTASSGLARYRPMGNPSFPNIPQPMTPPPPQQLEDVQYPPGMSPGGLDRWRKTGNPNPGMGMPPQLPPRQPLR